MQYVYCRTSGVILVYTYVYSWAQAVPACLGDMQICALIVEVRLVVRFFAVLRFLRYILRPQLLTRIRPIHKIDL